MGVQLGADDTVFWHWGDNPRFKNFAVAKRAQRSGVVIMSNSDHGIQVWEPIGQHALGINAEICDWLATTCYGTESLAEL